MDIANIFGVVATGFVLFMLVTSFGDIGDFGFSGTFGETTIQEFPHWFNQSTVYDSLVEQDDNGHALTIEEGKTGQFVSTELTLENRPYRLTNITYDVFYYEPDSEIVLSMNRTNRDVDPSYTLDNGTNFINFNHSLNGEDLKIELDFSRTSTSDTPPKIYSLELFGGVNRASEQSRFTQTVIKIMLIGLALVSIPLMFGS